MKNLNCDYKKDGWEGYPITEMKIDDLWASVPIAKIHRGRVFYDKVKADIAAKGLHFPILVVQSTYGELMEQKKRYKNKMKPLPFWHNDDPTKKINVVWGGSNRLEIARDLGYDSIDCVIMPSFDKARGMQQLHRRPFAEQFYGAKK